MNKQHKTVIRERLKLVSDETLIRNLITANIKPVKKLVFKEINKRIAQ